MSKLIVVGMLMLLSRCVHAAELVSRYEHPPLPAKTFWFSLDTSNSAVTGDSQWLRRQIDVLQTMLSEPWLAQRPLPSEGLSLGILAVTQLDAPAEVLHPSVPLEDTRTWPSQQVARTLKLIRNPRASLGDAELWPMAQPRQLEMQWPLPEGSITLQTFILTLPVRVEPAQWPEFRLVFPDGSAYALPPPISRQTATGVSTRLSLQEAIQSWQQAHATGALPNQPWTLRWQAQNAAQQGAWESWQPSSPALVSMAWEVAGAVRTGREQLIMQLRSLLPGEGIELASNVSALREKAQALVGSHSGCEQSHSYEFLPDQLVHAEQLAQWRDQLLALPPVVAQQHARYAPTGFIGIDRFWEQAVPGRRAWLGGHQLQRCHEATNCESIAMTFTGSEAVPAERWLSDIAMHQPLVLLSQLWSKFRESHPFWQSVLEPPSERPWRGSSIYVDAGASAAMPTGRTGLLLWLSSDGSVLAQEANSGAWQWAWRPRESVARWAELTINSEMPINTADAHYATTLNHWALWPPTAVTSLDDGRDSQGQRWLYGLVDQRWVVLNLDQLDQPKSGFLPLLNSEIPLQQVQQLRWGSLSLWPLRLDDGQQHPLLLLSSAGDSSASQLMLVDGRQGAVLWQASVDQDVALSKPWRAAWQRLSTIDDSFLAYGVDEAGGVWRLRIAAQPSALTSLAVSLNRVADFSATGLVFAHSPSLAWLRDNRGQRYPAISITASTTRENTIRRSATVFAFLDMHPLAAASKTAVPITSSTLAAWRTGAQPPDHSLGWLRELSATELIAQPARWLADHLVLVSEQPEPALSPCPAWVWQARIYRWPWRREKDGVVLQEAMTELPVSPTPVGDPYVSAAGELGWLGVPTGESATSTVTVPVGYRQRVLKRQLGLDD